MLNSLYHHFRNHHPVSWFLSMVTLVAAILFGIYSFTSSNSSLLNTLGLNTLTTRLNAGKEAMYWTIRAWRHKDDDSKLNPDHEYGYVKSVNRDATVNITLVRNNQYQDQRILLADLTILNLSLFANTIESHRHDSMEFAFYPTENPYPYAVAWLNDKPFNLTLITDGIALPDKTPPTNIVDRLFASYYWQQFTR